MSMSYLIPLAPHMLKLFKLSWKIDWSRFLELMGSQFERDQLFISFKSKSYSGKAFHVGAGVTVQEIYRAADARGVTVLGSICEVSHQIRVVAFKAD